MKYFGVLALGILLTFATCGNSAGQENETDSTRVYTQFRGGYAKGFNDLQDLHIEAAKQNGVGPLEARVDTAKFEDELVRIPLELEVFKVDVLKHSMPFLVPKASTLLADIAVNFRDSLISKKMPIYKLNVTSITRTNEDVKSLSKRNTNASDDSAHRYGTTFDISWIRYNKVNTLDARTLDDGKLKLVLAQVLHDLRQRDRCYVKHERRQSCFHITVR